MSDRRGFDPTKWLTSLTMAVLTPAILIFIAAQLIEPVVGWVIGFLVLAGIGGAAFWALRMRRNRW